METFFSKVVGVTHSNSDGTDRQKTIRKYCRPNQILLLIRDANNPHDGNAVAIVAQIKRFFGLSTAYRQIGFLPAETAEGVARHMDQGGKAIATVHHITGAGQPIIGVNIAVNLL